MRLSAHCHALAGFGYVPPWSVNAGFVCGESRTLIVDSGPTAQAAATILGYAETARPGNTVLAINTERHLDHIAGNDLLRSRGIEVWGHPSIRRTAAELAADVAEYCASVPDPVRRRDGEGEIPFLETRIADPNVDIERECAIDLGGVSAQVLLVPGHTPANLVVWIAAEGVAYTGDSVVSDYRPNLGSGGPADWRSWLGALDRIQALTPAILVPGHGRILRGGAEVGREIERIRRCLHEALSAPRA
jgi:glyoxylase-like metal-dependent hydrolase (beta-lactamase superfamily II)